MGDNHRGRGWCGRRRGNCHVAGRRGPGSVAASRQEHRQTYHSLFFFFFFLKKKKKFFFFGGQLLAARSIKGCDNHARQTLGRKPCPRQRWQDPRQIGAGASCSRRPKTTHLLPSPKVVLLVQRYPQGGVSPSPVGAQQPDRKRGTRNLSVWQRRVVRAGRRPKHVKGWLLEKGN